MLPPLSHDRYQLTQPLGHNAGRQTWLGTDRETGAAVVVKLLAFSPQMDWQEFKLFEREAQVLQQLNHPQIPRYRDYFTVEKAAGNGICWFGLVQDYIPADSLQTLLNQGTRFHLEQVREIAAQVLEILVYLHGLEPAVLHRDIKPSNLLWDKTDRVYLVDFGAVQNRAATEGVTFTVVGTTGYAPLEQFWGRAVPASDLYALGATLIHLLTGVAPADLPQRHLQIQFRDRVSLPSNFTAWITALTEPDLPQRYQNANQALADLEVGKSLSYPLELIPAPPGSRIKLERSPQKLVIQIGRYANLGQVTKDFLLYGLKLLLSFSSTLAFLSIVIWVLILALASLVCLFSLPQTHLTGAILLGMLGVGGFFFYRSMNLLSQERQAVRRELRRQPSPLLAWKRQVLRVDRDYFSLRSKLPGYFAERYEAPSKQLRSLAAGPKGSLGLEILDKTCYLGYRLSPTETTWLLREINDWVRQNLAR